MMGNTQNTNDLNKKTGIIMDTHITEQNEKKYTEKTSFSNRIDDFVESLQMGKKYGVVRIDWVLNNDIKGFEGGEDSWSDENNWENPSYTKCGIAKGALQVFMKKGMSPISFLAEYCKENKLHEESFFFPKVTEDFSKNISTSSICNEFEDFQLLKLNEGQSNISNEAENIINEESKHIFPLNFRGDEDDLNKFQKYQEAYVEILMRTSHRLFSGIPKLAINSSVITPVITRSISNNRTEILGAYMIITSTLSSKTLKDDKRFKQDLQALKYACKAQVDEKISQRYFEKLKKESIKSAISAIMSRNMSHNLGSHYMYYTKAYLENMAIAAGDIAPDIRGAAKVLGYVQARMDYLATVISNDKYPYGAVNFKSQIYDELTIDDFSHRHFLGDKNKRTTNFLLTNLIYSENFTRPDVRSDEKIESSCDKLFLHIKYSPDGEKYNSFTGTWHEISIDWVDEEVEKAQRNKLLPLPTITSEQDTKNLLSSLSIALPGGSMSCHAFFNVVENFIRNSAKYLRNDVDKKNGLICTLAIRPNVDNKKFVDIIIFDNKKNANKIVDKENNITLHEQITRKLSSLVVIDEQNKISKEDKGFKEILFSSIWMRSYMFGDKTYADIVAEINQVASGDKKLNLIEKYGFSLVKVLENSAGDISIFSRSEQCNDDANLGLLITLPTYNQIEQFSLTGDRTKDINAMLNTMADIVEVDNDFLQSEFCHVFTHSLFDEMKMCKNTLEKYRFVIKQRFPDIEKYSLSFGEKAVQELSYEHTENNNKNYCIYFCRHMDTQRKASEFEGYAYADSISGGNFTITMLDLFRNGIKGGIYINDEDEIFALKIKESALTRITLIDERLYNSTKESEYPWLGLRNIRILNYDDNSDLTNNQSLSTIFIGSSFVDKKEQTHFLSIHLGLIEKILKNSNHVNTFIDKKLGTDYTKISNLLSYERVKEFMNLLRDFFGGNDSDNLFIAVHSGRGNYSKELEGPLCRYPFISLSALENAYKNSKFQLAQLLYNTVYIGKGLANEQNTSSS